MAKVLVETSARHVHVTEEDLAILMHKDYPGSIEQMMKEVEGLDDVHVRDLKVFMQEVKTDEDAE